MKCRTCGAEIPSDTPMGQCPKCLFGLGVAAADEPAPARTPRCFAGYELVRQIGFGGMGVVYEARQLGLNRTVALKMILGGESCSPVIRRRFFLEAEAAARLDHPNIVPIYEVGEFEDQPFLSMKLVQGELLRTKMARGELGLPRDGEGLSKSAMADGERTIARLVAKLARAVHHAHTHNVVHRDLKPGNILFDASNTPYVTDFGLAKILDPGHSGPSARTEVIGTLSYMSPQQVRADAVSPATDIYSLGVILYELLAGQPPFHGATRNETLRLIETEPPTRLRHANKHIHKDLETICLKCLEKDTGNRYATAEALAEDLERWLANQPIKARPAGPFLRTGRWIKRNPLGTALIVTLAVALGATTWVVPKIREMSYYRDAAERLALEGAAANVKQGMADPTQTSVSITADYLASLQLRPLPNDSASNRLTLAVNITEEPIAQAKAFGPLLEELQKGMGSILGRPVIFNLKLCKFSCLSFVDIADGKSDFQRLGAVSYVRAQDLNTNVEAIVQEDTGKEAVILVRSNSPITKLSHFAGHSFAFGDTNSTINVLAKFHLARAGILGKTLSFYTNIDDVLPVNSGLARGSSSRTSSPVYISGWTAANMVQRGSEFWEDDFPGFSNLVQRFRSGSDPVSRFLWSRFPPETQRVLTNATAKPEVQQRELENGLNRVLRDKSIFQTQRLDGVTLSDETRRLLGQDPQGEDLIRLNRVLLQDAYPLEIAKRRQIDGAALQGPYFDRIAWKGLRAVHSFTITPNVYVAREGLDPKIKDAFQRTMLSISDKDLLSRLPIRPPIDGFHRPDQQEFVKLRAMLTNEVAEFEGTRSAPPPAVRESQGPAP